jgi:hypothetical protein
VKQSILIPAHHESDFFNLMLLMSKLIWEEIKRRLNSGNACYHLVQNLLSSNLLSKNLKIGIYKTILLLVVPYGV